MRYIYLCCVGIFSLQVIVGSQVCLCEAKENDILVDDIHLNINAEKFIAAPKLKSVSIGNSKIAQVKVSSHPPAIIIGGVAVGSTTLTRLFNDGSRITQTVIVHGINLEQLVAEISSMVKNIEGISVVPLDRDKVRIDGSVYSQRDLERVERITQFYKPSVLNLVELDPLYVKDARMIEITFSFAEVRKNDGGRWGIDWSDGRLGVNIGTSARFAKTGNDSENEMSLSLLSDFPLAINYLTARGHATVYDTHTIIVGDSQEATYQAGGQINVITSGLNSGELRTIDFGTKLVVKPRIGRGEAVELTMNAEVSDIDPSNSVQGIPSLVTNRIKTAVMMELDQTVAVSGLIRRKTGNAIRGIIGLNRIPILGYFFRSDDFLKQRSDAVLFITPKLTESKNDKHNNTINQVLEKVQKHQGQM